MTYTQTRTEEYTAELQSGQYQTRDDGTILMRCRCGRQYWMRLPDVARKLARHGAVGGCMCGKWTLQPVHKKDAPQ